MFIIKTAFRYIFSKEKGIRKTSVSIMLGISLAVTSFLVVLAVMATLRNNNLNHIRDIDSFDIAIEKTSLSLEEISAIEGVEKAFYFKDYNVLFSKKNSSFAGISGADSGDLISGTVRAVDLEAYSDIESIYFTNDSGSFIPSFALASALHAYSDSDVEIMFLKEGRTRALTPFFVNLVIDGRYRSSYYDFDSKTAFVSLDIAREKLGEKVFSVGVYCSDGYKNAEKVAKNLQSLDEKAEITTFIKANLSLYSALMLENRIVYIFLLLISLIVLMQLKSSSRRIIEIKQKDAGILRVIGLEKKQISEIFVLYGLFLLIIAEIISLFLSVLLCKNVNAVFGLFDRVLSFFGKSLYLSAIHFDMQYTFAGFLLTCLLVTLLGTVFIALGCKRVFKEDLMRVVLDVSY